MPRHWSVVALAMAMVVGCVAILWWGRGERAGAHRPIWDGGAENRGAATGVRAMTASLSRPVPVLPTAGASVLHTLLHEDAVPLASGVVVEEIAMDRAWVCQGERVRLSARITGEREPEAVYRWLWGEPGGGAALHPGSALVWQAPAVVGRHAVHFQVCKDLGGRKVGVLAEGMMEIEVRACAEGQGHEALRIAVVQRGHDLFGFRAVYQLGRQPGNQPGDQARGAPSGQPEGHDGNDAIDEYIWDFGDGTGEITSAPSTEHRYTVHALGAQETESMMVRLVARLTSGDELEAAAIVRMHGQPPAGEAPPVVLAIDRWRARADGSGWESALAVRSAGGRDIIWERLERVTKYFDDRVDIDTLPWDEVIQVDEPLAHGGFRGRVTVDNAAVPPEVKQLIDSLYGHDAAGEEVVVSWTPFKREAPTPPAGVGDGVPRKGTTPANR